MQEASSSSVMETTTSANSNGVAKNHVVTTAAITAGNNEFSSNVHISTHPVLSHKITIMRSSSTLPSSFRAVLREVTYHLGYEATKSLTTRQVAISVPLGAHDHLECTGNKLVERIALIPILRSGLGMVDSMLELLPNAAIHHIGMYRSKIEHTPIQYFNRLPRKCAADVAYVLDPVIATASTIMSVVAILKKWGVPQIHVISVLATRAGLQELVETHPDICVTVGTMDDELREDGTVVPGMGDSGDRLFGTPLLEDDDALLHPSKRKRFESDA